MSKTIKYTGTQVRWPELAYTGKQSVWQPGEQDERSDTEANQLLATGLFTQVYTVNDLPLASLVSGAGNFMNSAVLMGDSIMLVNGGPNVTSGLNVLDKAPLVMANAQLEGRLEIVYNAGVNGNTTADNLARFESEVMSRAGQARFLIINGGVNDPLGGTGTPQTFAQTKANLLAMVNRGRTAFEVLWLPPVPYAPTATVGAQVAQIADWVRNTAQSMPGVLFADCYSALLDKTATTGVMVSTYSDDSPKLHPNNVGARAYAVPLVAVLGPRLIGSPVAAPSQANTVANMGAAYATQVLPNPLLVNNGGTLQGTNIASAGAGGLAGAPSDYTVRGGTASNYNDGTTSLTCQLVARADGFGNDVQVVVSAGANAGTPVVQLLTASHHADVSPGQVLQGVFTLSASGMANVRKIVMYVTVTDSLGTRSFTSLYNAANETFSQADFANYVFKTNKFTLGTSITDLRLRVDITGVSKDMAGTFRLGKPVVNILPA